MRRFTITLTPASHAIAAFAYCYLCFDAFADMLSFLRHDAAMYSAPALPWLRAPAIRLLLMLMLPPDAFR